MNLFEVLIPGLHPRLTKSKSLEDKTQESAFSLVSSVIGVCVFVCVKLENHCFIILGKKNYIFQTGNVFI